MTETRTPGYAADKETLVKRLHRIEGQVRGIEKMVDDDRYCIDILTQISAVDTALEPLADKILDDHVRHCADALVKTESCSRRCTGSRERGDARRTRSPRPDSAALECLSHGVEEGVRRKRLFEQRRLGCRELAR